MADHWSPPPLTFRQQGEGKSRNEKHQPQSAQNQATKDFSVERTCSAVKVKIQKLEDEEKEKMSFYPKGDSNLIHYLCIHDLTTLAVEQGWKLILERMDQKLVAKLLIKKEVPIENCRDKVREIVVKALPNLHQESCCLSSLGNKDLSNVGQDDVDRSNQSPGLGNNKPSNGDQGINDPLQQALACLVPLISAGKNQADVLYDKNSNCVIITGPTETVKYLHKEAKIKLYSVTMETVLASPSHGYLLRRLRVMDQLTGQYPGLTVVIQDCNTRVTWTGTEENIRRGQQEVEKFIKEVKTDTFHVSMVMKKLLLTPEMKNYIDNALQKENITCVWQVTETGQVQVWSMDVLSSKRAGHKIRENCREETFFVKDFPLILEISKVGFGFGITEVNHFAVEETSDTVHVAAKSDTMQKIIQYLQDLEEQQTLGKQPSVKQGGDNSEKTTSGCTIEVRGMNKQTSNDTVELYFESRRAAGRPVDIEKFDDSKREKDGVIFITYENEEDAQLVLGRQHTLDKCPLTVRLCEPLEPVPGPSLYQEKVFFRNMNPNTTRKTLENFLKSNVSVTPIEFLYGKDEGAALVTFDGAVDFEELMNACADSTLENCLLEAKRVPVSHSVLVSGVGKKTNLDTLELYFENSRRSGGSDVTEVQEISEGNLIVTFEDAEAIDKVCQRTHKVDGKTLTVQIYHELLGHRVSLTGPTFQVPSPLVIKEADKDKFQQLLSTDVTKLEKQLGDHHAKLHWPGDIPGDLRLECLLTQEVEDSNRLVVSWEEVVRDILRKFLAQAGKTKAQVAVTSPDERESAKESSTKKDDNRDHFSESSMKRPPLQQNKRNSTSAESNRRFDNTPLQENKGNSTPTDRHRFSQSFTTSRSSWTSQSTAGYGIVGPKDFTTPEGLLVRVYPGSILHLDVDCIVNAANGDLQHGGGVAYVISNAAGYEFERESRDYIARYGPLRVGEVCTTSAGNLKYKGVIHAIGPRWYDYREDEKLTCLDDLKLAVKNSLDQADLQQYESIAVPAISSGMFGVPKEQCVQQYYRAVEEYSRTRGRHSTLTEVHFIDKDIQMCELIQKIFTKCFSWVK